jgi:hypothetical protein
MKKLFAVALATLVVAGLAFGQGMPAKGKMTLGIGGELSLPMGDFGDAYNLGYGGSARFQYGLEDNITLYGTVGYLVWSVDEDVLGGDASLGGLEFLAGGKYGFGSGFYGLAELGITSFSFSYDYTDPFTGQTTTFDESDSKFMLAPGVGYAYKGLTLEVKYFLLDSDFSNFAFRVGYDFAL